MLWFLHPEWFPWEEDDEMILRVPEMVKKIGMHTPPAIPVVLD
jgi:hypothetical protein